MLKLFLPEVQQTTATANGNWSCSRLISLARWTSDAIVSISFNVIRLYNYYKAFMLPKPSQSHGTNAECIDCNTT